MGTRNARPLSKAKDKSYVRKCRIKVSRQFAVERRNNFANSLGSTSGRRNDIVVDTTTTTPVLLRWAINGLWGGSSSMDSSHQTLDDPEIVVDDLGQWRKAVSGAGRIGNLKGSERR